MDLKTDLRWIAQWPGHVATPRRVVCHSQLPDGEAEWATIYDLIIELIEARPEPCGCFVVGTESEWLVTTAEDGEPTLTICLDRRNDSFEELVMDQED